MKVLHLTTSFIRKKNDVITPWLIELLVEQARYDEIFVLTSGYKDISKKQKYKNIKIFRFNYAPKKMMVMTHDHTIQDFLKANKIYLLLLPSFFFIGIMECMKLVKRYKIEYIFIHWPFPLFFIAFPSKLFFRKKLISVFYGAEIKLFKNRFKTFSFILDFILKNSFKIFAISNFTRKEIEDILKNKNYRINVLPYGVKVQDYENFEKKENFILFVGRLVERKGVDYLIKSIKYIDTDYKLFIIGDGYMRKSLERLVKIEGLSDRIKFFGFVDFDELKNFYRKSKIFVLPAIHDKRGDTEGLGMVLVEAILNKTVAIGTSVGGITDIIEDGKTGLLVKEKDEKDIAEKINFLIKNEIVYKRLQEEGYRIIREKFSIESIVDRYRKILNEN